MTVELLKYKKYYLKKILDLRYRKLDLNKNDNDNDAAKYLSIGTVLVVQYILFFKFAYYVHCKNNNVYS